MTVDDALWAQSIVIQGHLKDSRQNSEFHTQDEGILWSALGMGVTDAKPEDRPWDASTRAMRFASVIGDRLWGMYTLQQQQVCFVAYLSLNLTNKPLVKMDRVEQKARGNEKMLNVEPSV